jgi:hypothetical protein
MPDSPNQQALVDRARRVIDTIVAAFPQDAPRLIAEITATARDSLEQCKRLVLEEPLPMNAGKLAILAEIVQPVRGEIMAAIVEKLAPKDTDTAVSLYTLAVGLMLGDLCRAMIEDLDVISASIADTWRVARWPMVVEINRVQ